MRAKSVLASVQRPTLPLSQMAIAADMPKADKLAELSEDDADLVQVMFCCSNFIASLCSSPACAHSQRLAIMMLRNELKSSSHFRYVNISHRQFVEVRGPPDAFSSRAHEFPATDALTRPSGENSACEKVNSTGRFDLPPASTSQPQHLDKGIINLFTCLHTVSLCARLSGLFCRSHTMLRHVCVSKRGGRLSSMQRRIAQLLHPEGCLRSTLLRAPRRATYQFWVDAMAVFSDSCTACKRKSERKQGRNYLGRGRGVGGHRGRSFRCRCVQRHALREN